MKHLYIAIIVAMMSVSSLEAAGKGKHLFILSGQSNMARLDPNSSFTPAVEAEFGKQNVIVVKDAQGGQPIRRWYKKYASLSGATGGKKKNLDKKGNARVGGGLYDRLMEKVNKEIAGANLETVTFVWMQGEKDSQGAAYKVYKEALTGLIQQLSDDMKRDDLNYVIGRLTQYKSGQQGWDEIRKIQQEVAEASPRGAWVDSDNCELKDIHHTPAGYKELGKLFAEKAIELVKKSK
ncbi:hypothetical protein BVX97_03635 [bacterium E08(2017)]|nr:hypothetical protein BVX97_03635 [bacterium E08(2017)]